MSAPHWNTLAAACCQFESENTYRSSKSKQRGSSKPRQRFWTPEEDVRLLSWVLRKEYSKPGAATAIDWIGMSKAFGNNRTTSELRNRLDRIFQQVKDNPKSVETSKKVFKAFHDSHYYK